jgi:probable phosphoglycerate mutase
MPTVWFIRHGESESNADLRTTHPAESALTPAGEREAEAVANCFPQAPDLIVTSPYLRARQTAELTQDRFPRVPVEEWPVYEFTYLDPVRYLNTTGSERMPYALRFWERNDPTYKDGGEGESFAELMGRVDESSRRLRRHPAEFIVVFSHGLFLRALTWALLAGSCEATADGMLRYRHFIQSVWLENGAIIKCRFTPDGEIYFTGFEDAHLIAVQNPSPAG